MYSSSEQIEHTKLFLWMRIVAGTVTLSIAALQAFKRPHDALGWVNPLSLALFFILFRLRQPAESRLVYWTNPRGLLTNLAALSVLVTGIWYLIRIAH